MVAVLTVDLFDISTMATVSLPAIFNTGMALDIGIVPEPTEQEPTLSPI